MFIGEMGGLLALLYFVYSALLKLITFQKAENALVQKLYQQDQQQHQYEAEK